jgi:hypothetical protein
MTTPLPGIVIKEIHSKRSLADYLTEFARSLTYADLLAHYVGEHAHGRAEVFDALNCAARGHDAVIAEFRLEQERRKHRRQGRTVYHFVISRRGKTDPEVLVAMAKRMITLTGLQAQKAIIAVHTDTDDHHVHVAVSALDEAGKQIILEKGHSRVLLAHINAQLCHEFGFEPETGLGFYANDRGVFRSSDDKQMRDASFVKATTDLRKAPAMTQLSGKHELHTGMMSNQRLAQREFERAHRRDSLREVLAELAAAGIDYQFAGSGASIGFRGERYKASAISRSATPAKLATRFNVTHFDQVKATRMGLAGGAGFYERDEQGVLRKLRMPKVIAEEIVWNPHLPDARSHEQAKARHLEKVLDRAIPAAEPAHAAPLRQREAVLRSSDSDVARWQIGRLRRAAWATEARKGRPSKHQHDQAQLDVPNIPHSADTAILLGPPHYNPWLGTIWAKGLSSHFREGAKTIYRGTKPLATFTQGMVTIHQATEADKRKILRLARNHFGDEVTVFGSPRERRRLTQIATQEDIVFRNPELGPVQRLLLDLKRRALDAATRSLTSAMGVVQERCRSSLRAAEHALAETGRAAVGKAMETARDSFEAIMFPTRPTANEVVAKRVGDLIVRPSVQIARATPQTGPTHMAPGSAAIPVSLTKLVPGSAPMQHQGSRSAPAEATHAVIRALPSPPASTTPVASASLPAKVQAPPSRSSPAETLAAGTVASVTRHSHSPTLPSQPNAGLPDASASPGQNGERAQTGLPNGARVLPRIIKSSERRPSGSEGLVTHVDEYGTLIHTLRLVPDQKVGSPDLLGSSEADVSRTPIAISITVENNTAATPASPGSASPSAPASGARSDVKPRVLRSIDLFSGAGLQKLAAQHARKQEKEAMDDEARKSAGIAHLNKIYSDARKGGWDPLTLLSLTPTQSSGQQITRGTLPTDTGTPTGAAKGSADPLPPHGRYSPAALRSLEYRARTAPADDWDPRDYQAPARQALRFEAKQDNSHHPAPERNRQSELAADLARRMHQQQFHNLGR